MNIRWSNVAAFALLLLALVIGIKMRREIAALFSTMPNIGPGHTPEEQVIGLIAASLILVAIVAMVRILANGRRGS